MILAGWCVLLVIVRQVANIDTHKKSDSLRADAHTEYADRVVPLMHEELPNMHAIDNPRERVAAARRIKDHNKKWDKAQSKMRRDLDKADDEEVNDDLRLIVCGVVVVVVVVLLACGAVFYAEGLL